MDQVDVSAYLTLEQTERLEQAASLTGRSESELLAEALDLCLPVILSRRRFPTGG